MEASNRPRALISWSQQASRDLATAVHTMLDLANTGIDGWISSGDIKAGREWRSTLRENLGGARIGIACITPGSARQPWVHFECGYLAASTERPIVPFLLEVDADALKSGPLEGYQAIPVDDDGWVKLMEECWVAAGQDGGAPELARIERVTRALAASDVIRSLVASAREVAQRESEMRSDPVLQSIAMLQHETVDLHRSVGQVLCEAKGIGRAVFDRLGRDMKLRIMAVTRDLLIAQDAAESALGMIDSGETDVDDMVTNALVAIMHALAEGRSAVADQNLVREVIRLRDRLTEYAHPANGDQQPSLPVTQ